MRTIWISTEAFPPDDQVLAAAAAAGAGETMHEGDEALLALGIPVTGVSRLVRISEPGDPPADLAGAQAFQLAALQAARAAAILAFSYQGFEVPLTEQTQNDVGNAVSALQSSPEGTTIDWEIVDGLYVPMGLSELQALGLAAFSHVQACFANSRAITLAIAATASAEAVYAVDLTAGWPS